MKSYILLLYLSILLLSCNFEKKRNKHSEPKDSIIVIEHSSFENPKDIYKVNIHKDDYAIIKRLRQLSKGVFYVDFALNDTHLWHLTIREKHKNLTKSEKEAKPAKIKLLQSFLFNENTILKLQYLERLYLLVQSLKGTINIQADFKKLKVLGITDNPALENIYFREPMNLKILQIPKNGIKSINPSFKNLVKLKDLTLFGNQLQNIDLDYIPWVQRVGISDNPISFDRIDSLRLKYPNINIVAYHYKKKRPGNYIDRDLDEPVYE